MMEENKIQVLIILASLLFPNPLFSITLGSCIRMEPVSPENRILETGMLFFPLFSLKGGDVSRMEKGTQDRKESNLSLTWEQPLLPGSKLRELREQQKSEAVLGAVEMEERKGQAILELLELLCSIVTGWKEEEAMLAKLELDKRLVAGQREKPEELLLEENRLALELIQSLNTLSLEMWNELSLKAFPPAEEISIRGLKQLGELPEEEELLDSALAGDREMLLLIRERNHLEEGSRILSWLPPDIVLTTAMQLPFTTSGPPELYTSWALQVSFSLPGFSAHTSLSYQKDGERRVQAVQEGELLITPYPAVKRSMGEIDRAIRKREVQLRYEISRMVLELGQLDKGIALKEGRLHLARKDLGNTRALAALGKASERELAESGVLVALQEQEYTALLCQRLLLLSRLLVRSGRGDEVMAWQI